MWAAGFTFYFILLVMCMSIFISDMYVSLIWFSHLQCPINNYFDRKKINAVKMFLFNYFSFFILIQNM